MHADFWAQYGVQRNHGNVGDPNHIDNEFGDMDYEEERENLGEGHVEPDNVENERPNINAEREVSTFLIGLREKHKVSHEACNYVAREMKELLHLSCDSILLKVEMILQNQGINPVPVELNNTFQQCPFQEAFEHFSDARNVIFFCKESSGFVEPVEYVLSVGTNKTMQFVSILDTIKALLMHNDIFAEVINGHASQDDSIQDYCDGRNYHNNALLSGGNHNIHVQLYNDDFCVANPLGNKVKKLKFSAFYFLLGNLAPQYRSKLDMIQLCCLCKTEYLKEFGLKTVLTPLIAELKELETNGITIEKDGAQHLFHGTVSMVVADNLAAHSLGGFRKASTLNVYVDSVLS